MLSLAATVKAQLGTLPSEIPLQARVSEIVLCFGARFLPERASISIIAEPEAPAEVGAALPRVAVSANGRGPSGVGLVASRLTWQPQVSAPCFLVPDAKPECDFLPKPALPDSPFSIAPLEAPPVAVAPVEQLLLSAPPQLLLLAPPSLPDTSVERQSEAPSAAVLEPEAAADSDFAKSKQLDPSEVLEALANAVQGDALEPDIIEAVTEPAIDVQFTAVEDDHFETALVTDCVPLPPLESAPRPHASAEPLTIDALPEPAAALKVTLPAASEIEAPLGPQTPPIAPAVNQPSRPVIPGWLISLVVATTLSLGGAIIVRNMDLAHKAAAAPAPAAEPSTPPQEAFAGFLEVTGLRVIADLKNGSRLHYVLVNHSATQVSNAHFQISVRSAEPSSPAQPLFTVSGLVTGLGPYESRDMVTDIDDLNSKQIPDWQFLKPEIHLLSK